MEDDSELQEPASGDTGQSELEKQEHASTIEEAREVEEPQENIDVGRGEAASEITSKRMKKKHSMFIVIVAVLLVLAAIFFIWKDQIVGLFVKQPVASQDANSQTTGDKVVSTDPALTRFISPTTGETWYSTPKEMENQGWLKNDYRETFVSQYLTASEVEEIYSRMKPTYYEVGTHGTSTIIMARQPAEMGSDYAAFFEKTANSSVKVIAKPSSTATYDQNYLPYFKDTLQGGTVVTVDETTRYDSLSLPETVTFKEGEAVQNLKSASFLFGARSEGTTETVVMELGASKLYRLEKSYADTKLTNIGYVVRTSFGPEISVDYVPNTRSLEKYTFTNGKAATYTDYQGATVYDEINAIARGCGGTSAAVTRADALQDSELVEVGKTDTGRAVYALKDKASALVTKAYDEYKQSYDNPLSLDDYIANHGLLIIKNTSGDQLVYVRGQLSMGGGCAKPVVYLYPTTTTRVTVRIGADVTLSDPFYPQATGWQNVLARPDGQLTYNGSQYDSLFWEGTGYGDYPEIGSGTVVKRTAVVATMKRQLAEQGLHAKEIADFVEFWQDKIPNKPYVRLTWLTTEQMNTLAPLYISPKPDTLIRVFLDMGGFDTPVALPAQKLVSTFRSGFTVVEWGGLTSAIE